MLNLLKCSMFANKLFLAKTATIVYPPKAQKKDVFISQIVKYKFRKARELRH